MLLPSSPAQKATLIASLLLLAVSVRADDVPRGVFCLLPAGIPCEAAVLSNPSVDGISIRQTWADLEPTEGHYNWSFLDAEVAQADAAGKPVLLRVLTQNGKPKWVTAAITAADGKFFTFTAEGVTSTIPVFWDPTFLAKKKAMIAALGAHFSGSPAVKIVAVSFANARSEDWNVPHTPQDIVHWQEAGYTSQKLLDTGKTLIDAAMTAFPNQLVTLAVADDGLLDSSGSYVALTAIATARASWPGRLIVQKNSLSAVNPPAPGTGTVFEALWNSRPDVAGQMLSAAYGDPTYRDNGGVPDNAADILHRTINIGVAYGMNYIEIYQLDVLNLPDEITYGHNVLVGNAPLTGLKPKAPTGLRRTP